LNWACRYSIQLLTPSLTFWSAYSSLFIHRSVRDTPTTV